MPVTSKENLPTVMVAFWLHVCFLALVLYQSGVQGSDHDAFMTTKVNQQLKIVNKHNSLRRSVEPPASNMLKMEWHSEIASNAQHWANECTLKQGTAERKKINGVHCGENIFTSSIALPWSKVIQNWYDNRKNFQYGTGATSPKAKIGVYTQVVWYNSYQVGCALAFCPGQPVYKYVYVCQYCPPGNRVDLIKTPYKTGKQCGDCPDACDKGLCTNPCKYSDKYINCPSLKKTWGCGIPLMQGCEASCKCTTEIK